MGKRGAFWSSEVTVDVMGSEAGQIPGAAPAVSAGRSVRIRLQRANEAVRQGL